MQEKNSKEDQGHNGIDNGGHGEGEPVTEKKMAPNSVLATEMKKRGIACETFEIGSHPLERKSYYSYVFPLSPRMVTNKGLIKISGRNIDFVQVLQRN